MVDKVLISEIKAKLSFEILLTIIICDQFYKNNRDFKW